MATSIFKLVGSIFVENNEANKNIEDTGKKADKAGVNLASMAGKAFSMGKTLVSAASSAAEAMLGLTNKTAAQLDGIQKGAQQLGISYEAYQKLSYAAERSGTSIEKMSKGIKNVTQVMANMGTTEATKAMDALGVMTTDANGELRDQEDVLKDVLKNLANMTDETKRNALASKLFGGSYQDLLPLLNQGGEGIENLMQRCEDLGLVMSDEAVESAAKYSDSMADVKAQMDSMMLKIGSELMPIVQSVMDWINEHSPEIQAAFNAIKDTVRDVVTFINEKLQAFLDWIDPYIPVITGWITDIRDQATEAWNDYIKPTLEKLWDKCKELWEENLEPLLKRIMEFWTDTLWPTIKGILDAIAPAVETVIDLVTEHSKGFLTDFGKWIDRLETGIKGITDFLNGAFSGDWEKAWNGLVDIFGAIVDGMIEMFKKPMNFIIDGINTFIEGLNNISIPDWVPGVGGYGINLDYIPKLARGGEIGFGGAAIVGEAGAELLELPAGARVTPLNDNNNAFADMSRKLDELTEVMKQASAPSGDTIIPVYIGQTKLDEVIVKASKRVTERSGGFASV